MFVNLFCWAQKINPRDYYYGTVVMRHTEDIKYAFCPHMTHSLAGGTERKKLPTILCFMYSIFKLMVQKNSGSKINIKKSTALLYTNDEASEKRNKGHHPIHNSIKNNKYSEINLTKKWKIYEMKTINAFWKKSENTQANRKIPCVHGLE